MWICINLYCFTFAIIALLQVWHVMFVSLAPPGGLMTCVHSKTLRRCRSDRSSSTGADQSKCQEARVRGQHGQHTMILSFEMLGVENTLHRIPLKQYHQTIQWDGFFVGSLCAELWLHWWHKVCLLKKWRAAWIRQKTLFQTCLTSEVLKTSGLSLRNAMTINLLEYQKTHLSRPWNFAWNTFRVFCWCLVNFARCSSPTGQFEWIDSLRTRYPIHIVRCPATAFVLLVS